MQHRPKARILHQFDNSYRRQNNATISDKLVLPIYAGKLDCCSYSYGHVPNCINYRNGNFIYVRNFLIDSNLIKFLFVANKIYMKPFFI